MFKCMMYACFIQHPQVESSTSCYLDIRHPGNQSSFSISPIFNMKRRREEELYSPSLKPSKLTTLMQFLSRHNTPRTSSTLNNSCGEKYTPSSSSLLTVVSLIQTKGILTEVLSTQDFLRFAANSVSASGVSLLLSALYQSEICNDAQNSNQMQHQNQIQKQMPSKVHEYESIASAKHLGSQSLGNKGGNASSTQSLAILSFVERLLLMRYKHPDLVHPFNSHTNRTSDAPNDVIVNWIQSNVGLTAAPSSSASKELRQDVDDGIYYIPAMAFMMAYKTLRKHLASASFTEDIDASTSRDARKSISLQNVAKDAVVITALQVIFISKSLASALIRRGKDGTMKDSSGGNNDDGDGDDGEYVLQVFRREMDMVDSLVRSIKDAWTKSKNPSVSQHSEGASPDITVIEKEKSRFQELWEAAQVDHSCSEGDSDDEDPHRQDKMHGQVRNTTIERMDPNHKEARSIHDHSTPRYVKDLNDLSEKKDKVTPNDADPIRHADLKDPDESSEVGSYEDKSLNLRSVLLVMSKNAGSSEIESIRDKIVLLLNDAGAKDGADGISRVASLLIYGRSAGDYKEPGSNASDKNMSAETTECVSFPESLISSLVRVYVVEMMSTVRVSAFLTSFVLPSIAALAPEKSRPASRQLVTVVTSLVRNRPVECIHSLVMPTLMGKAHQSLISGDTINEVSKAQCELISRLVKSNCFPIHELSKLVEQLVSIKWSELSMGVITTIVQKKPALGSITIQAIVEKIDAGSNEARLVKSTKFSTLFHTFVTKYGSQIKNEGSCEVLLKAATALTTLLGKAIISSLKKNQKLR